MSVMGIHWESPPHWGPIWTASTRAAPAPGAISNLVGESMRRGVLQLFRAVLRHLAVPGLALLIGIGSAAAQSGPQDQSGKPAANSAASTDPTKDSQRKT